MLPQEVIDQIIALYNSDPPISQCEIARRLGINRNAVQYWIKKYKNSTPESCLQGNKGRPRKLSNPQETHRQQKLLSKQSQREDSKYLTREAESACIRRKRKRVCSDPVIGCKRQKEEYNLNWECDDPKFRTLADKFFVAVSEGPTHQCYCCDRLWFKRSIIPLSKTTLLSKGADEEFIKLVFYKNIGDFGQFCKTCYDSLMKLKVPELAMSNGFEFPEIPDCLKDLTPLEERLVSPRLIFMQIHPVRGCQYKLKGSVVNVPIKMDTTVNSLPRNMNDSYTVFVALKKRLTHKSNYMAEIINPDRVFRAAIYLFKQELYKAFDIGVSMDWYTNFQKGDFNIDKLILDFEQEDENDAPGVVPTNSSDMDTLMEEFEKEDDVTGIFPKNSQVLNSRDMDRLMEEFEKEDEMEVNPSGTHTLITSDSGICLAPGENNTPVSLLFDNCAEELAFPTIYCGKVRNFKSQLTYSRLANSEIRRSDRRAARPDHLLYAYSKFNHHRLLNAINISVRKKKLLDGSLTAENLLDESFVNSLVNHNEGYKFLKGITNAPAHWENEKRRVFAAIRQWGVPTLFVTLSAAETHWFELMQVLYQNVDHQILTKEQFEDPNAFPYDKKRELIQKDPVTCALYFDHRFRELMKTWKNCNGAFGKYKIKYFYYRIEFQHRGSPHVHMLLWLENAPAYSPETLDKCEKFVEELMTCSINNPFIDYQTHRHTSTCYKKTGKDDKCRFQIPYFPMDRTRILEPFNDSDARNKLKEQYLTLRDYLSNLDWKNNKMSFDEFLRSVNLTYDKYISVIQSGINRVTVFLKRNVNEIMINNYSPKTLNLMRSNMDIQYITNAYACASYMVDYINKSQRGMSSLLKKCVEKCRGQKDIGLRTLLKEVADTYLLNSEVGAQEAAWTLLELKMSTLSVDDIFIPTFPPGDRARMVKDQARLKALPSDSSDVFELSIIDKYIRRPADFETLCLADFATGYEFKKEGEERLKLTGLECYMRERRNRKVLRSVNYKIDDPDNYHREHIMLYMPWRDEKEDIINKNVGHLFEANASVIEFNKGKYNNIDFDIDDISAECPEEYEEEDVENEPLEDNGPLEFEDEFKVTIQRDLDEYVGKEMSMFKIATRWENSQYLSSIRKANIRQFDLLKHVMHLEFNLSDPSTIFITGPAGCGKSYTINIIEQTLMRLYDKRGFDPSALTVLKVAPTGKAAYNIKGLTLHAAFALPLKMKPPLPELSPSTLQEYREIYGHLKTIIIDEISMVSYTNFRCIDQRMKQIMGNNKPFGNLNVFCFGDFRQLPPVGDLPVYRIPPSQDIDNLVGNRLWEAFQFYELNEIMRQKDDMAFAECLNHIANGTMRKEDIALISKRIWKETATIPPSAIHLFYTNAKVDAYNSLKLASLETEGCIIEAHDCVTGAGTKLSKKAMLEKVKKLKRQDTANLPYKLTAKIGAKYVLAYNLNTADGLVNGAMGILRKIEFGQLKKEKKEAVQILWIEFEEKEIGTELRREYTRYMVGHDINPSWKWTPIKRLRKTVHKTRNSALSVCREQFPIVVSEALTIHKSQGATYNECAVHVEKNMKRNLMYVGLSRVTKAEGLYVVGEFQPPKPPSEDDPLTTELQRLKMNPLIPVYQFLHDRSDFVGIQFMFHNVQGLMTHYEDLLADPCFTQCDMILLAETHTIPTDNFQIPGFQIAGAIDSNNRNQTRKNRGVMTYIKEPLIDNSKKNIIVDGNNVQILITYILNNVRFAVCYASPQATVEEICLDIVDIMMVDEDRKTVLVGDFNIDFNSAQGREFIESMTVIGLELRTNPTHYTTLGRTTIDAIFSNKGMRTGVYMTSYSYHMALYGRID